MTTKTILVIYMFAGVAAGSVLHSILNSKTGDSPGMRYGILAVSALLILWNIVMYWGAASAGKQDSAPTAVERFTRPVAATVSFVVGAVLLFL